ncbi:MAG: site-specific DNA-methyltransferase [Oleibacter sp.]|nr:site-specific DNA-methyltransferase [Thalassolituus sp.]
MKNVISQIDAKSSDSKSMDIVADNISKLKELFPEAFTEGKVDFDALKEVLGNYIDGREERYSFTWNGKSKARMLAQTPSTGTLRPWKDESVDWDITQNLFIEGDNLEVLKLLQKSYHKKVKMIYIDPPYNTGKDFVYKDNFKDNIKNYKEITGQVDGEGRNLSSNPETSGRYHTDWLNMMYPRLKLARNLLQDDGVIFISIDGNEQTNLQKICDEVFGEENIVGSIIWRNVTDNNPSNIATEHEYILVYAKSKTALEPVWKSNLSDVKDILIEIGNELNEKYKDSNVLQEKYSEWFRDNKSQLGALDRYKYIDKGGVYTGSQSVHNPGKEGYRYDVLHPETKLPCKEPLMGYRFPESTMNKLLEEGKILFGSDHNKIIELKVYAKDYLEKLSSVEVLDGRLGAYDVRELFSETTKVFTNPKPVTLIEKYLSFILSDSDIVLDFFAGSATTAHALMRLNKEDNGGRRFILVQLPEILEEKSEALKAGYQTISEISKERIRRAATKIKEENPNYQGDLGFKVFKLDSTNIKPWELDFDLTEQDLEDQISNIKHGRKEEDVLYEVLLKYGLDLTLPIAEHNVADHKVFDIGMGALMICLSDDITLDVVEGIAKLKDELNPEIMRVVFKDAGFADDVVKTNAVQILKQAGIEDVRSL